jgi:hypothetical protein
MRPSSAFAIFAPLSLIVALVVASCATPEPVPVVHFVCPKIVTYTPAEQAEAAAELETLLKANSKAETPIMITDYVRLLAAIRACKTEAVK